MAGKTGTRTKPDTAVTNVEEGQWVERAIPAAGPLTKDEAQSLDTTINTQIAGASEAMVRMYVELGRNLVQMRDRRGYEQLGFDKWEHYLDGKRDFGRTYLSYLYKLGKAEGLDRFVEQGMSASKLIEFVKKTSPDKVEKLIEATIEEVKDKGVRETSAFLSDWVSKHPKEFGKERKGSKAGRKPDTFVTKFEKQFEKLAPKQRKEYLNQMALFLAGQNYSLPGSVEESAAN